MKCIDELEHRQEPLSVKEAAKIYGDSAGTFYKKIRRGEIPGIFREAGKPKGRIKICPAEFAAWLKQKIAAGCQAANGISRTPANGAQLATERAVPQSGAEPNNATKAAGKEIGRFAG